MNSSHDSTIAHGNHEPPGRGTRPTSCRPRALTRRFMESLNSILRLAAKKILPAILLSSLFRLGGPITCQAADDPKTNSSTASPKGFRFKATNDKSLGLWE